MHESPNPVGWVEGEQSLDSPRRVAKEGVMGKSIAAKFWKILKITG